MKRVDVAALAVETSSGNPVVVLREHDPPHRLLSIFVGGPEATSIALAASGQESPRPLTHDLMATLLGSLDTAIDSAEITELSDGAFLSTLALHGPAGEQRLDSRPSDAIALAVRAGAPLYVSEAVLDEAGVLPTEQPDETVPGETVPGEPVLDETEIDQAVDEFRAFLDGVEPEHFAADADAGDPDDPGSPPA
ncbi:MAG: bifunctional nuclease family protein [Ilumatobacteraceae bacterium]